MRYPSRVQSLEVFEGRADSQICKPVAIEVAGRERKTEVVAVLIDILDPGAVLMPQLVTCRAQARRRSVENIDRAGVRHRSKILPWNSHCQIIVAIAVEVSAGQSRSEPITVFRDVLDPTAVLVPELVPCC